MATPPKYQTVIKDRIKKLDPARRELMLKEFDTYKWNLGKIEELEKQYGDESDIDRCKKLLAQRHQLVTENAQLFSHMMRHIGTEDETVSELDSFLNG